MLEPGKPLGIPTIFFEATGLMAGFLGAPQVDGQIGRSKRPKLGDPLRLLT